MSSLRRSLCLIAGLGLALPAFADAQASTGAAISLAPTASNAAVGVRPVRADEAPRLPSQEPTYDESRNLALIIAGGAGILVGSVIGGDAGSVVILAGGVVLLVGLYRYLR